MHFICSALDYLADWKDAYAIGIIYLQKLHATQKKCPKNDFIYHNKYLSVAIRCACVCVLFLDHFHSVEQYHRIVYQINADIIAIKYSREFSTNTFISSTVFPRLYREWDIHMKFYGIYLCKSVELNEIEWFVIFFMYLYKFVDLLMIGRKMAWKSRA